METALSLQDSEPVYYSLKNFLDNDKGKAFHGFFGRQGGFSAGIYTSLNCGPGSEDDIDAILKNRRIVSDVAGISSDNLLSLHQVHSDICVKVEEPWDVMQRPQADAMVSDTPGIGLGILTADCVPVLFYGENSKGKPVIGAAHAGWKGALKGILESTLSAMEELDVRKEAIKACIGPCINKTSYEVSEELYERFTGESDENDRFFISGKRPGHFMFDLAGYCAFKLYKVGLSNIYIKDLDTYFNEEDFFSYRRAVHRGEEDYGRQVSLIAIKP